MGDMTLDPCEIEPLNGFGNNEVKIKGTFTLTLVVSDNNTKWEIDVKFYVVTVPSPYNAILGRTTLTVLQAVTFNPHLKVKFPIENETGEATKRRSRFCT